jgi:hypothetical protein
MAFVRSTLLLLAIAFSAAASDIQGTWKVVFTSPTDEQPKTVSEIIFNLSAAGDQLTGTAHIGNWPGDAPLIPGGKIEGDHFSFMAIGRLLWRSGGPAGEASGLPKLTFTGTIHGKDIELTLLWDNVMLYGNAPPVKQFEMKGERIPD